MNKPQPTIQLYIKHEVEQTKTIVFWAVPDISNEIKEYGDLKPYANPNYLELEVYPWYNYQEVLSYLESLGENK